MLVKNWMTQPVITIDKADNIATAKELMSGNQIRTLPVLSDGQLVGIVTDRDLKKASVSEATGIEAPKLAYLNTRVKVGAIMTKNVITVKPNTTVDEVAKILHKLKISGVPVVDDTGSLVGMISQSDIFKLLISLTGIEAEGTQIAVEISTETGTVKAIADIIRGVGGRINNLLTSYENVPEGFRRAYFKTTNIQADRMKELIRQLESQSRILFIIEYFGDETSPQVLLMNI